MSNEQQNLLISLNKSLGEIAETLQSAGGLVESIKNLGKDFDKDRLETAGQAAVKAGEQTENIDLVELGRLAITIATIIAMF